MQSHSAETNKCQNWWEFTLKWTNDGTLNKGEYDLLELAAAEGHGAASTSVFKAEFDKISGRQVR